jgi:diguanylate cyclase (GGDEF)-like protein/putative nucleotidyltransferase with HDIG domain/PAS domain S-box-containing protein
MRWKLWQKLRHHSPGRRLHTTLIDDELLVAMLDLFEEHVYIGVITPDNRYEGRYASSTIERFVGGQHAPGAEYGGLWETLVHPDDRATREEFHARVLAGEESETTYRVVGLDGVTRSIHDYARPVPRPDGSVLVQGIISDVTHRTEADERASEAADRFFTLLSVVGEHVYVAAALPDGSLEELFQGPGADRLLGGADPDTAMTNWETAIHPDDRPAYDGFNESLRLGRRSEAEYRLRGADGVTRWVHDRAATRDRPDGSVEISGIVSDVTERRRLEDELRKTMGEMETAHQELEEARQAAELIAHTDELTGTLSRRRFAALAAGAAQRDRGVLLLDADHFKRINDRYGHAMGDRVLMELADRIRGELAEGDLLARWGGEEFVVLIAGVETDAELTARAEAIRSAVQTPAMVCADRPIDLSVSIGGTRASSAIDLDRLVDDADRALYVAKARGRNQVCLTSDSSFAETPARAESDSGPLRTAWALAHATSLGQPGVQEHLIAVADLCAAVATRLGLDDAGILRCRLAGLLHDIGKVAVPDAILYKPGALTESEWAIMRSHCAHGESIVLGFDDLRELAPIVRHHHERFDGEGYPDRLSGEAIPIEARIIAATDTYSAIIAHRAYRAARTPEEAVAELRGASASQLDPRVVNSLLAHLDASANTPEVELRTAALSAF